MSEQNNNVQLSPKDALNSSILHNRHNTLVDNADAAADDDDVLSCLCE